MPHDELVHGHLPDGHPARLMSAAARHLRAQTAPAAGTSLPVPSLLADWLDSSAAMAAGVVFPDPDRTETGGRPLWECSDCLVPVSRVRSPGDDNCLHGFDHALAIASGVLGTGPTTLPMPLPAARP